MARKHTAQRSSLASLLFLVGAASGTFLTLSNFRSLTSSVSLQCLYAYNLPIRGCSPSDFIHGATCSETCIEGLQAVQFSVRELCANVNTASNSLLLQVKEGHILNALCKVDATQMTTTTSSPSHPPKQTPPSPQESSKTVSKLESTTIDSITTTSSASSKAVTTSTSTLTSVVSVSNPAQESTTEVTNAPTSQATNEDKPSSTSEEKPKPTRSPNTQPGSGGGSPFDFVAIGKATHFGLSEGSIAMAIAIAFMTLTLI